MEKVATRGQILWLKCNNFDFGWGSAPDPAGGAHGAPPDLLAGFKGPTSKGEEGRGRKVGGKDRRGGKKKPPFKMSAYGPAAPDSGHCRIVLTICNSRPMG